ncbi:hypothetical protein BP00DRAFT_445559 [Aspergillus indologenus CBS 114.80]|uniref:Uncharacterized protein n=1 Tax=Aspergillus indologenus CBS 114.80 TaxID=1450541 RepID=A0A2V5I6X6_9EURO|nr:hypothetical protein BP00DRAFT_445559 [Aspergillus indologenus CBS 114.80]
MEPFLFDTFSPGAIKPTGWLQDQIQLSADGLGGNLMEFYRYVQRSTWLGGEYEYSELHESSPYWFNYIVPLAWSLDDDTLKSQARYYLDYQYAEADPSQEERVVDAMHKFVVLVHSMLGDYFTGLIENKSLGDNFDPNGFGLSRTHELPISLMWLYDNHPRNNSQIILGAVQRDQPSAFELVQPAVAGFAIDASTALFHRRESSSDALANPIFAKDAPPVSISVDAYRVNWPTTLDAAALPPIHPPVNAADRTTIKLIPFGAAKLRIAQFPVADISAVILCEYNWCGSPCRARQNSLEKRR